MEFRVSAARLRGDIVVPGSKSHTIRGVLLASLAEGESILRRPLASSDTTAAVRVYRALGASFDLGPDEWRIRGVGPAYRTPSETLDTGNSGTTMNVALGTLALLRQGEAVLTGDAQIQRRPNGPLAKALCDLGASVVSERGNGCPPFRVRGGLRGGHAVMEAKTSQYVTSLLLCCPLADGDTTLEIPLMHEKPYAQMTLDWLHYQGVKVTQQSMRHFQIPGGQRFRPFDRAIPADFSTATFFLAAGALGDNEITCHGLDRTDSQPDKAVVDFLQAMGAEIRLAGDAITVRAKGLQGQDFDLNDCPDALPMMAVMGCFAEGTTRLLNVPQARIKETDRIAVMCAELRKLGADIEELPDGLVIRRSQLHAGAVEGHGDHRVVMSLSVAASQIAGETRISTAEAAAVTVPEFENYLRGLGGTIRQVAE
jgi:3-phosphoshikimate 1-carboxyvinyltransferase